MASKKIKGVKNENFQSLFKQVSKEQKKANRKIASLEKADLTAKSDALRILKNNIKNTYNIKFNKSDSIVLSMTEEESYNELQKELKYLKQFNNSKTSTATGLKKGYSQRRNTFNEEYGIKIPKENEEEFYNFIDLISSKADMLGMPSSVVLALNSDEINNIDYDQLKSDTKDLNKMKRYNERLKRYKSNPSKYKKPKKPKVKNEIVDLSKKQKANTFNKAFTKYLKKKSKK